MDHHFQLALTDAAAACLCNICEERQLCVVVLDEDGSGDRVVVASDRLCLVQLPRLSPIQLSRNHLTPVAIGEAFALVRDVGGEASDDLLSDKVPNWNGTKRVGDLGMPRVFRESNSLANPRTEGLMHLISQAPPNHGQIGSTCDNWFGIRAVRSENVGSAHLVRFIIPCASFIVEPGLADPLDAWGLLVHDSLKVVVDKVQSDIVVLQHHPGVFLVVLKLWFACLLLGLCTLRKAVDLVAQSWHVGFEENSCVASTSWPPIVRDARQRGNGLGCYFLSMSIIDLEVSERCRQLHQLRAILCQAVPKQNLPIITLLCGLAHGDIAKFADREAVPSGQAAERVARGAQRLRPADG
mmetsp:Transcript_74578/g.155490  ORF Transcript_74578/g.155490 Transcript_74578/m.155490 type:complete len:354 (-) Transcript_74578:200-1261(-)